MKASHTKNKAIRTQVRQCVRELICDVRNDCSEGIITLESIPDQTE